jgi:hypothetical protein
MYVNITLTLAQKNCNFNVKNPHTWNSALLFFIWEEKLFISDVLQSSALGYNNSFWMPIHILPGSSVVFWQKIFNHRRTSSMKAHSKMLDTADKNSWIGSLSTIARLRIINPVYVVGTVFVSMVITLSRISG